MRKAEGFIFFYMMGHGMRQANRRGGGAVARCEYCLGRSWNVRESQGGVTRGSCAAVACTAAGLSGGILHCVGLECGKLRGNTFRLVVAIRFICSPNPDTTSTCRLAVLCFRVVMHLFPCCEHV